MFRYLSASIIFLMPFLSAVQSESFVENASIIANSIEIDAEGNFTAKGNVEVHYKENILKAKKIYYKRSYDELSAEGPLSLIDHTGNETTASDAVFKNEFQEAILLATRVILENQLEISAEELKYEVSDKSIFSRVSATSCKTCENERPFWRIKAKKVSHNKKIKTIYFYDASLEILGVPTFYTPFISIPDPSAKRALGFLAPQFLSNSRLDFGVKLPFFIPLDVDKDVTFTPFITPQTKTLELRYRQAFQQGTLIVDSALTTDALHEDKYRGYLSLNGSLNLEDGYKLNYSIERVSDNAYLGDYGYSGRNGLSSGLSYSKTQADSFFETSIGLVQSLYEDDISKITIDTNSYYDRVIDLKTIPGRLYINSEVIGSWRNGTQDIAGRDVARIGGMVSWQNTSISTYGLEYGGSLDYGHDIFIVDQDSRYDSFRARSSIGGNAYTRYPLIIRNDAGVHLLEPLAQVAWGWREQSKVISDESTHTEFDMGNLIRISRFAASDKYEDGPHAAFGIRYSYDTPENHGFTLGLGKVLRNEIHYGFTDSSGLKGINSDNYISATAMFHNNSYLSFQGLVDNNFQSKKTSLTGGVDFNKFRFDAEYSYLLADLMELRRDPIEEWKINSNFKINQKWDLTSNLRFDEVENHLALLGAGISYKNQCVTVNLEMDRRYSLEGTSPPTTNFSFAINFKGFSSGSVTAIQEQSCK